MHGPAIVFFPSPPFFFNLKFALCSDIFLHETPMVIFAFLHSNSIYLIVHIDISLNKLHELQIS